MKKIDKWFITSICALSVGGVAGAGIAGVPGAIVGAILAVLIISHMLDRKERK